MRAWFDEVDADEGLAYEIDFLAPVFAAMQAWDYTRPDILELKFEDLVADDVGGLTRAFEFIGLGPESVTRSPAVTRRRARGKGASPPRARRVARAA